MKQWISSLKISLSISANMMYFGLTKIPLLGKLFPLSFYRSKKMKYTVAVIMNSIMTILSTLLTVVAPYYQLVIIWLFQANQLQLFRHNFDGFDVFFSSLVQPVIFIQYVMIAVIGGCSMQSSVFRVTTLKTAYIRYFKLDLKAMLIRFTLFDLLRTTIVIAIGMIPFMFLGEIKGYQFVLVLIIALLIRFASVCLDFFLDIKKISNRIVRSMMLPLLMFIGSFLMTLKSDLFYAHFELVYWVLPAIVLIIVYILVFLKKNPEKTEHSLLKTYRLFLQNESITFASEKLQVEHMASMMDESTVISSGIKRKKGFSYFNAMFVARHRKVLWRPIQRTSVAIIGLMIFLHFGYSVYPELGTKISADLVYSLGFLLIVIMYIHRGSVFCEALFFNCDHSMLTYHFYREPKAIIENFWIRFRTLLWMNSLPIILIAGTIFSLAVRSHVSFNREWILFLITVLLTNVFYSFHYLFLYTIFQPYSAKMEMKSYTMIIIQSIFTIVLFNIGRVQSIILSSIFIVVTIMYMVIGSIIIYKVAPKSYRLKD